MRSTPSTPALLLLATLALTGCEGITGISPSAQLRIVDAAPVSPPLNLDQGTTALAYALTPGSITSYVAFAPGSYTLAASTASGAQPLATLNAAFAPASQYTLILAGSSAAVTPLLLQDRTTPAPAGHILLRILSAALSPQPLDLYLISADSAPHLLFAGLIPGSPTAYLPAPAGTYSLAAVPAGLSPAIASTRLYSGPAVTYPAGYAGSLILLDTAPAAPTHSRLQPTPATTPLQLLTAPEYDPTP